MHPQKCATNTIMNTSLNRLYNAAYFGFKFINYSKYYASLNILFVLKIKTAFRIEMFNRRLIINGTTTIKSLKNLVFKQFLTILWKFKAVIQKQCHTLILNKFCLFSFIFFFQITKMLLFPLEDDESFAIISCIEIQYDISQKRPSRQII